MLCGWKDLVGGWFLLVSPLARGSLLGTSAPCVSTSPGALLMSSPSVLSSRRQEQRGQRGQHRQHTQRWQRPEHRGHQRAEHQHPHRECQGRCQPLLPPRCSPSSTRYGGDGAQHVPVTPAPPGKEGAAGAEHPPPSMHLLLGFRGEMFLGLESPGCSSSTALPPWSGWYHVTSSPHPGSPERIKGPHPAQISR